MGWVDTRFEEENGCPIAFTIWQEIQTTSLLKLLHETGNWNWLRTQEIISIDECPNLICHPKDEVLTPRNVVKEAWLHLREPLGSQIG